MKYLTYDYDYSKSLLDNILTNRGVVDIDKFLDLDCEEENPLRFSNMQLACAVLYEHIKNNSTIVIVIDSDCDGYTSSSILIQYLKLRYPNINIHLLLQKENKAHGLNDYILSQIDLMKPDLVIAPDSSSSDFKYHRKLIERNIALIVLDHHEFIESQANENISKGIIIVNNHGSNDVNKYISAVGVVYLFIKLYNKTIFKDDIEDSFLDVVALGLIADSCSMRDIYTRKLTIQGIENISNEFIKALLIKQKDKIKTINIMSIAFYISPLINACIRISPIEDRMIVYNALTFGENIEEAVSICVKAKSKQDRIRDKEYKALNTQIIDGNLQEEGAIIVVKDDITPAIVGLVANKISDKYKKPAIVLRNIHGTYFGSIRNSVEEVSFKDWLNNTGVVNWSRGHSNAAGISIDIEKLNELKALLPNLNVILGETGVMVDRIYDAGFIDTREIIDVIENEDLWGNGVKEPIFAIKNITLSNGDVRVLGKNENTLKFRVFGMDYLMFNVDSEVKEEFSKYNSFKLEVIGRFNKNIYKGNVQIQFIIEDFSLAKNNDFFF